jgi:glycosyltransferase involved in cell wall biosynthesis
MADISFCIPALNEAQRIGDCINSILAELNGALISAEVLVVDNGSIDDTKMVALQHGATVVDEPCRGLLMAREAGYRRSSGRLIANIDADCRLRPGWLSRAIAHFENPEVAAVSGPYRYYDLPASGRRAAASAFRAYAALSKCGLTTMMGGNAVIRRSVLDALDGYDTSIEFWGEDTWTALACAKHGRVIFDSHLVVDSSGRRLLRDGYMRTFGRYVINHFAVRLRGAPTTKVEP